MGGDPPSQGYGGQVLLRPRPMIGTTRPRPKILAPRWLQFFFIRSSFVSARLCRPFGTKDIPPSFPDQNSFWERFPDTSCLATFRLCLRGAKPRPMIGAVQEKVKRSQRQRRDSIPARRQRPGSASTTFSKALKGRLKISALGPPLQGLICILSPFPSATLRLHWATADAAPLGRNLLQKAPAWFAFASLPSRTIKKIQRERANPSPPNWLQSNLNRSRSFQEPGKNPTGASLLMPPYPDVVRSLMH